MPGADPTDAAPAGWPPAGQDAASRLASDHARLFSRNVVSDAALWCAMVALLLVFRAVLLWLFRAEMDAQSDASQIARCFAAGLRFDVKMATFAICPSLALTLVACYRPLGPWHDRVRKILCFAVAVTGTITFVVDAAYFGEYHDQFNHWIFGLVFDDRTAIAQTIWKSYPVIWLVVLVAALAAAQIWAGRRAGRALTSRVAIPANAWVRRVAPIVIVALVFLGMRGSLGRRPVQMKDAAVTSDPYLNKLVMNPFAALWHAVQSHLRLSGARGLDLVLPSGDVRGAARAWFPSAGATLDLDLAVRRTAAGAPGTPPRHVILVVLESYDAWGLRPECAALHATDRLAALGRSGIAADAFVSASDGTMTSLATLITGLPAAGVRVNYQPGLKAGVPTSTAEIFKRLGYRTRFSYGGYLSWERLGDFCREQGFDEVHGGGGMSKRLTGNEWGVDDEVLFAFVADRLDDRPSFDMIMTTSYHPPYSVDLAAKGFPSESVAAEIAARGFDSQKARILGHLWYSDEALGDFVAAALAKHPDALIAITGDHWSRRAFTAQQNLFGRRAVPFVLCGKDALRDVPRPARIAGSHVDIVPTLVELTAPRGFVYHSFGRNLLDATLPQVGYGSETVLTPNVVFDVSDGGRVEDMQGRPASDQVEEEVLRLRYRQLQALGWWRAMKGKDL